MLLKQISLGTLAIVLATFLWSVDGVLIRPKFYNLPAGTLVFLEHLIALIILIPVIIKNRSKLFKLQKQTRFALLWVSLFGGVIGTITITKAFFMAFVGKNSFAEIIILQKLQPVFALILAGIILKEKPPKKFYFWAGIAIFASYLLAVGDKNFSFSGLTTNSLGFWLAILAAFSFGSSTVFGKQLVQKMNFSLVTIWRIIITVFFSGIFLILTNNTTTVWQLDKNQWQLLLVIAIFTGIASMYIYYLGLQKVSASQASIAELFYPISAILLDLFINHKSLTFIQIIGTLLLLFAIYKINQQQDKEKNIPLNKFFSKTLHRLKGKVIQGKQYGQTINIPTANIQISKNPPPSGVYHSIVTIGKQKLIGSTFINEKQNLAEVHLINFNKNIYNKEITINLIAKIRNIQTFKNEDTLTKQIKKDIKLTKKYFSKL